MILVDTSIWIDGCRDHVPEELALGSLKRREQVLTLLGDLWRFPTLAHEEVLALVQRRQPWGGAISAADAHLLGSTALVGGAPLCTRVERLRTAYQEADVATVKKL